MSNHLLVILLTSHKNTKFFFNDNSVTIFHIKITVIQLIFYIIRNPVKIFHIKKINIQSLTLREKIIYSINNKCISDYHYAQ